MRIVHSENKKVYKCEVCPKQCKQLESLKEHLEVEHCNGEKVKHYCDTCSYWTYRRSTLYVHKRLIHKLKGDI